MKLLPDPSARRAVTVCAILVLALVAPLLNAPPARGATWPDVSLVRVWRGLSSPTHLTHAGDGSGRLFVCEKTGRLLVIKYGQVLPTPFLDLRGKVGSVSEGGLLSVAFPPGFAAKQYFYVSYTDVRGDSVIERYHVSADQDRANASSGEVILTLDQPYGNHNGGLIEFGPDGYLYIGLGDGGGSGDPLENGQDPSNWFGTILRIDVEGPTSPYGVPASNPFVGVPGHEDEIWAYGLRNPWRFSFDRSTGDLYIADVGQNAWEEINFQPAGDPGGQNYGWDMYEGTHVYEPPANPAGITFPVWEYDHATSGHSVTGGFVYRGPDFPALDGIYVYGDFEYGQVWGLRRPAAVWENHLFADTPYLISSFGEDEAGEVYMVRYEGEIYQVVDDDVAGGIASVGRVSGSDRYETAAALSLEAFPAGASTVVLARGDDFPDALCAAGLAGSYGGPVLLTASQRLPAATLGELQRLGATTVIIIGGEGAVATTVEDKLVAEGFAVDRLAGSDRYGTAADVARAIEAREGPTAQIFVATGADFPDVLAATPLSYAQRMPVLLVSPKGVPGSTLSAIDDIGATSAVLAGGTAVIPESVRAALGIPSERVYGSDRYGTAAGLADYAFARGWTDMGNVGVATGLDFPDGLTGGASLGQADGTILLTRQSNLPAATDSALSRHVLDVTDVGVLGGTTAVSASVEQRIGQLLQ